VTTNQFRKLALSLPEASENSHMGHPDFRVGGKIFATIPSPNDDRGMVKLSREEQSTLVLSEPEIFQPCQGAWGRQGCTYVNLRKATKPIVQLALISAWRNTAPKHLIRKLDDE